jgi:hypothetical protein
MICVKIKKITIENDGKGLGADWKVNYVKIVVNNETYKCVHFLFKNKFWK